VWQTVRVVASVAWQKWWETWKEISTLVGARTTTSFISHNFIYLSPYTRKYIMVIPNIVFSL
jgi:hypothetical protein